MVKFARYVKFDCMKKSVIFVILMSVLLVSGCDMFRRMAGRPTSEELELKKVEIERRNAMIEAMKAEQKQVSDSLAMLDSLRQMCSKMLWLKDMGGIYTTDLDAGYYIIVGSFRNQGNADAMIKSASDAGFVPVRISFRNGLDAIGVAASSSLEDALLSLKSVKREDFCPPDVWILVNR